VRSEVRRPFALPRGLSTLALLLVLTVADVQAGSITEWREALAAADVPRVLSLWRQPDGRADRDDNGATMLHRALHVYSSHQADVVKALLDAGAPVNEALDDGSTPLHWATRFGGDACVPLLLARGADVKARDDEGNTPLFSASAVAAPLLIAAGADPLARNRRGEVPLHRNRQGTFLGAGVDVRDAAGLTPLHFAALSGDDKAIEWLLAQGADPRAETLKDTHFRASFMSTSFGPGDPVPAGSRPYDLALELHRRTRWNTGANEAPLTRLDAATPRRSWLRR